MKKILLLLSFLMLFSCTQSLEPTQENMNAVFESKDFTLEFHLSKNRIESMSFIEDIIVFKTADETKRRTISYDEALLINNFIQKQFLLHKNSNTETPSIIILNTAKKVTLKVPEYEIDYLNLINKLAL